MWEKMTPQFHELSEEEAHALFEREVRTRLGISPEEFVRRWSAGELDPEDPDVRMVAMILPLARGMDLTP